jgi:hypothetical protein
MLVATDVKMRALLQTCHYPVVTRLVCRHDARGCGSLWLRSKATARIPESTDLLRS